ncbi:MAG TPA: hypothetical protein VLC92_09415 [Rhodocyclaceae bacterium]|nr:hypothetical protein [Rhodocyclaceae bacterium]
MNDRSGQETTIFAPNQLLAGIHAFGQYFEPQLERHGDDGMRNGNVISVGSRPKA